MNRKEKRLRVAQGVLGMSLMSHLIGYGVIPQIAKGRLLPVWGYLLSLLLILLGVAQMGIILRMVLPALRKREVAGQLIKLALGYGMVQIVMALLVGGMSLILYSLMKVPQEAVKTITDIFCRIIQIPVYAGASICFLHILTGKKVSFWPMFLKAVAACTVYMGMTCLLPLAGNSVAVLAVRMILISAVTCVLGIWLYEMYQRGKATYEDA